MCAYDGVIWLNTTQVAKKLSVSVGHVRNLINAGRFDHVRDVGVGTRPYYQVARDAVDRFLQESAANIDQEQKLNK